MSVAPDRMRYSSALIIKSRQWLSHKLWCWSLRVWEDWHLITFVDGDGKQVCTIACFGQFTGSWQAPYDMTCSCEADAA